MDIQVSDEEDISSLIKNVFGSAFEIRKNEKLSSVTAQYAMYSFDKQGRTFAFSKKEMDSYYTYENAYVFSRTINEHTVKSTAEELMSNIYPTLKINKEHYETVVDLIFFTPLDEAVEKAISHYRKTKLVRFGLQGHVTVQVIGIDRSKGKVCGSSGAKELLNVLRKELKNYE